MKIPILDKNKCSVLISEYATGHVFKKNMTLFQHGENENEVFQIFENIVDARNHTVNFIAENPRFECTIYNQKGEFVTLFNLNGEWKDTNNKKNKI